MCQGPLKYNVKKYMNDAEDDVEEFADKSNNNHSSATGNLAEQKQGNLIFHMSTCSARM
jgi:hypothetical protein